MSARVVLAIAVAISVIVDVAVCAAVNGSELVANEGIDKDFAIHYLQRYGYLNENTQAFRTTAEQRSLRHSISMFQEYYKLRITGELNDETLNLMRQPRCGMHDILDENVHPIQSYKWKKTHLTWNFYVADKSTLDIAQTAFNIWQNASRLTFKRDVSHPNILISWSTGRHLNLDYQNGVECKTEFDGPGGVLAHAYLPSGHPNFTSEVHVDRTEQWHISLNKPSSNKFNLLYILTHEIGHSLGLLHSSRPDSVMYAFTTINKTYPVVLSNEDRLNIQNLYGSSDTTVKPPITTTSTPAVAPPDLCELKDKVDAILLLERRMYIASGGYIWSIRLNDKRTYGKPLLLSSYFKFLQSNFTRLTATYQTPSGDIMLFVNDMVYKVAYPSFSVVSSWPRTFDKFGLPANTKINAVVNTHQGKSYVIYNDYAVGEIDDCSEGVVKHHHILTIFPGIPPKITSAFRYLDGNLYFMKRDQFYKFNEFTGTVLSAGKFDLEIVDIACPREGLLQQLRDLLNRIARTSDALTYASDDGDEEET